MFKATTNRTNLIYQHIAQYAMATISCDAVALNFANIDKP